MSRFCCWRHCCRWSAAELFPDVTWSRVADVTCDDVERWSVADRAGGRSDVGGRRAGATGRRRNLGDADECARGRDTVRQAAWGPRDALKPPTAARRRLPRTSVRLTAGRPTAAVHATNWNDRAVERSARCAALQACLSADITSTWTPPRRGLSAAISTTWTPARWGPSTSPRWYDAVCQASARRLPQSERLCSGQRYDIERPPGRCYVICIILLVKSSVFQGSGVERPSTLSLGLTSLVPYVAVTDKFKRWIPYFALALINEVN